MPRSLIRPRVDPTPRARLAQADIDSCFDIEAMVVQALTSDKRLLNAMFVACGRPELEFIRNSGATMGGLFGVLQLVIWIGYTRSHEAEHECAYADPSDDRLLDEKLLFYPIYGFIVGALTNWLALLMIFSPIDPVPIFGGRFVLQGLFLKRQRAVSAM